MTTEQSLLFERGLHYDSKIFCNDKTYSKAYRLRGKGNAHSYIHIHTISWLIRAISVVKKKKKRFICDFTSHSLSFFISFGYFSPLASKKTTLPHFVVPANISNSFFTLYTSLFCTDIQSDLGGTKQQLFWTVKKELFISTLSFFLLPNFLLIQQ